MSRYDKSRAGRKLVIGWWKHKRRWGKQEVSQIARKLSKRDIKREVEVG